MDARVKRSWIIFIASTTLVTQIDAQTLPDQQTRVASRQAATRPDLASDSKFQLPPGASGPYRTDSLQTVNTPIDKRLLAKEMDATKIIARVADEVILAGDLYGQVNQFLHGRLQEVPAEQRNMITPELLNERRWQLMKQVLPQVLDGKVVYLDFLRSLPAERIPEIQDSLFKAFDQQQLPTLIERADVQTAADLDQLLRGFGSSLDHQRRTFAEQLAAVQWKERSASNRDEVSHEDMLVYYRDHKEEYRIVAKTKWEQLSALDSDAGSREESRKLVAQMGNEVFRGAAFAAVAKRSSQGSTASEGGSYGWTTRGSLRSDVLDEAIFTLPVGYLSKILEDDDGCHIVRVVERQEESFIPFSESQDSIRTLIREARSEAALQEYVKKLREEFPVWTVFDDNPEYVGS